MDGLLDAPANTDPTTSSHTGKKRRKAADEMPPAPPGPTLLDPQSEAPPANEPQPPTSADSAAPPPPDAPPEPPAPKTSGLWSNEKLEYTVELRADLVALRRIKTMPIRDVWLNGILIGTATNFRQGYAMPDERQVICCDLTLFPTPWQSLWAGVLGRELQEMRILDWLIIGPITPFLPQNEPAPGLDHEKLAQDVRKTLVEKLEALTPAEILHGIVVPRMGRLDVKVANIEVMGVVRKTVAEVVKKIRG